MRFTLLKPERTVDEDQASFNSFSVTFVAAFETAFRPRNTVKTSEPRNFAIFNDEPKTLPVIAKHGNLEKMSWYLK